MVKKDRGDNLLNLMASLKVGSEYPKLFNDRYRRNAPISRGL
jgi:hypothetical protein